MQVTLVKLLVSLCHCHRKIDLLAATVLICNGLLARDIAAHPLQVLVLVLHERGQASLLLTYHCILVCKILHLADLRGVKTLRRVKSIALEVNIVRLYVDGALALSEITCTRLSHSIIAFNGLERARGRVRH